MWNAASTPIRRIVHAVSIAGALVALAVVPAAAGGVGPKPPTDLTLTSASQTALSMRWKAAEPRAGRTIVGYRLYLDGVRVDAAAVGVTKTSFDFVSIRCARAYVLGVAAIDSANVASDIASVTASTMPCATETVPPTVPGGPAQTASTTTSVTVSWAPSSDDALLGYSLSLDGGHAGTTTETGHTFEGLECGRTYTFGVAAFDSTGNYSPEAIVSATTSLCALSADTASASSEPGGSLKVAPDSDARVVEAYPTANYGKSSYVRVDAGSDPDVETYLRFAVSGLQAPVVSAKLRVYATSGTANGPAVYATANTWSEATVTWNNRPAPVGLPSDDAGAIPATNWFEWDVTKLVTGDGAYSFILVGQSSDGVDMSSREGSAAPQLVVTFGTNGGPTDTTLPSAPGGFAVTSATEYAISLSWTASTDDVGISGYNVYRDGQKLGSTSRTSYEVTALACGKPYVLGVEAYDAAGNVSARTSLAASTSACPPAESVTCDKVAAPSGSDSAPGTLSQPYLTAQKLASSLTAGQTGCLRGGRYTGGSSYVLNVSADSVTVRSYPGERAVLAGITQVRDGADGVTLARLSFEGSGGSNTVKIYGDDAVLEDSELTNFGLGDSCLMLGSTSGGIANRPVVRRNRFHDCGDPYDQYGHGIYASQVTDGRITGNLFWNSYGYAIQVYPNAQRTLVAHNVIDGGGISRRGGITVGGDTVTASSDNVIEYNVISYAATYGVKAQSVTGSRNIVRNNCFWQNSSGDTSSGVLAQNSVNANPLFLDRASRDYRIDPASACLSLIGYDAVEGLSD